MRRRAILVNGVPASGKSTVVRHLVSELCLANICAIPMSLDTVKEALFAELGIGDRDHNRMLGRASYDAIFRTIAAFPDNHIAVIDAWHGFQPPTVLVNHLATARIDRVLEIWCAVTPETAATRYLGRERHPGHPPASYADELRLLAERAAPLERFGSVIRVDTEQPLDQSLAARVLERLKSDES